jgi:hypothetical protein
LGEVLDQKPSTEPVGGVAVFAKEHAGRINSIRELEVWNVSMDQVFEIYRLTERFPRSERFGLLARIGRMLHGLARSLDQGASKA